MLRLVACLPAVACGWALRAATSGAMSSRSLAAPPTTVTCCAAESDAEYTIEELLEEGSVVEYLLEDADEAQLGLGVYTTQAIGADAHIRPLCAWSEDSGASELLWDEEVPMSHLHRF